MALEIKTPKLIINRLVIIGKRKEYHVEFYNGLNIIYGDSDTGKSSVLNLIDYCLGAKEVLLYDELEETGEFCLLDLNLLDVQYTIKRNIFNVGDNVEIFSGAYDQISDSFPKYVSPNYKEKGPDGFLSDFLLTAMNIPITKVKQSPSKEESGFTTVSFRDIFKYCFINQDKVGDSKIFGENYVKIVKLQQTFKLMFNVLDLQITEQENLISERARERDSLIKKNNSVSAFLRETNFQSLLAIEKRRDLLDLEIENINAQLEELNKEIKSNSVAFDGLRRIIHEKEQLIELNSRNVQVKQYEIQQNIALRNDYEKDIVKISSILEGLNKSNGIHLYSSTPCPVCEQAILTSNLVGNFSTKNSQTLENELSNLKRRKNVLQSLFENLREDQNRIEFEIQDYKVELNKIKEQFDLQTREIISPYINQRDTLVLTKGRLQGERANLQHFYKVRKQQSLIEEEIKNIENKLEQLRSTLVGLKENAPSIDAIFENLGTTLKEYLDFVGMKNVTGISISPKTYLPIIRNKDYEKITSGGVRTLASVGYYISLLEYAIQKPVNYPSFLMIDTIAKYLGKTKDKDLVKTDLEEDKREGMNDPNKYENIYNYLLALMNSFSKFQIIVVDNDLPNDLAKELEPFVRKHFSANKIYKFSEVGLIDDI